MVIVNWNTGSFLRECVASILPAARAMGDAVQVIVVDNASTDDSLEGIELAGLPLRVVRNPQNRGFAYACNQGARASVGELVLFLNPDTRLTEASLRAAADFLDDPANGRVGIAGIQLVDEHGITSRSCSRFPTPSRLIAGATGLDLLFPSLFPGTLMREWDHGESREVDQVMGAFFMVRREIFRRLGGFDQRFFVYYEEVDFCRRALDAGWTTWFCADARAFHKGRVSSDQVLDRRLFYSLSSRLAYSRKHFGKAGAAAVSAATLLLEPLARMLFALWRRSPRDLTQTLGAYGLFWSRLLGGRAGDPSR